MGESLEDSVTAEAHVLGLLCRLIPERQALRPGSPLPGRDLSVSSTSIFSLDL